MRSTTRLLIASLLHVPQACPGLHNDKSIQSGTIWSSDLRVLNNGTSPVLSFQKFSRWYCAYSGVVLKFLLGLLMSMVTTVSEDC